MAIRYATRPTTFLPSGRELGLTKTHPSGTTPGMRYLHSGKRDRAPELIRGSQGRGRARPASEGPNKNLKVFYFTMCLATNFTVRPCTTIEKMTTP